MKDSLGSGEHKEPAAIVREITGIDVVESTSRAGRKEISDSISENLVKFFDDMKKLYTEMADVGPKLRKLLDVALGFAAALAKYPKNYRGPYEYMGQKIRHASSCGKWVEKIRKMAGLNPPQGKVVFDGQSRYSGRNYRGHQASPNLLRELLAAGDCIWYYNGNENWRGLHSAMFLGWKDKDRLIANCAGGDRSMKWRVYEKGVNLSPKYPKGNPVVWINKPIA